MPVSLERTPQHAADEQNPLSLVSKLGEGTTASCGDEVNGKPTGRGARAPIHGNDKHGVHRVELLYMQSQCYTCRVGAWG